MTENESFKIKVENKEKYYLVKFIGLAELDLYSVKNLEEVFQDYNQQQTQSWVLDLTYINFIDSSGIGAVLHQSKFLRDNKKTLYMLKPNSNIMHIFSLGSFNTLLSIIDDLSQVSE
ncbi:MAG: STAS domain-containing protein [Spirochaetota bacterium]